jgi:hypothetical protein
MDAATRNFVRERAARRCEYCTLHEDQEPFYPFHLEHITARQHGGADDPDNLAWACHHCNFHKGTNLSAVDPDSSQVVLLFHPRRDVWDDHFEHRGAMVEGKTPIGRATVRLLKMNAGYRVELRGVL